MEEKLDRKRALTFFTYKCIKDKLNLMEGDLSIFIGVFDDIVNSEEYKHEREHIIQALKNMHNYINILNEIDNEITELMKSMIIKKAG